MTKISVITVSYNAQDTIEKTIQSVRNQTFKDFEYILVDGNSKDKTLEIAGQHKDFIKKWISEPDRSKFDAMNKGILLAQGEYTLFLDANDVLASDDVLEKFANHLGEIDIVYGNVKLYNPKRDEYSLYKTKKIDKKTLYKGELILPGEFIKTSVLENLGGFDTRFRFEAGYELNIRAILDNKASVKYIDETLSIVLKDNEKLLIPKRVRRSIKEKMVIQKAYFSKFEKILYNIIR